MTKNCCKISERIVRMMNRLYYILFVRRVNFSYIRFVGLFVVVRELWMGPNGSEWVRMGLNGSEWV